MVKNLLNSWDNLKKLKYNLIIVPVCINYDRIFDSKYFQEDVMKGIFKPGTTLFDIMHMIYSMRQGKIGKVFINYAQPIHIDEYYQQFNS